MTDIVLLYNVRCGKCNWLLAKAIGTPFLHCRGCNTTYKLTVKVVKTTR